jgi:hypothetical protein
LLSSNFRWRRWTAGAAGLLAAYTVLGFWLVPLAIQHQIPKFGQSELARQASVGEVKFNPFTLRLTAANLRLAEADGAPLLAIGNLAVELQWRSLVRRAWSFAEIRVTSPSANLVIAPDGKFNFAELLATLERRPHEASTDTSLPRLVVERFALEQGKVDMHDRRAGYANLFSPIDFALADFSTLPDQNDTHALSAQSAGGGKLRWKGHASVNPIRGGGELTLENVSLPELSVYLKSYTRARIAAGQVSAILPYSFSYADAKFDASLAGARLSLRDLALAREGATDSFAALTRLDLNDVNADLVRRQATVTEVRADGAKLTVRRDAKGDLDLANLMIATAGPAAAPGAGAAVVINNWKLAVKQVLFDRMAISAVDETVSPPLKLGADQVRLQLQLAAEQSGSDLQLKLVDAAFSLADLSLASGELTPFKLAQLGFTDGTFDLAARRAGVGRLYAQAGQLQLTRDREGKLNILGLLPKFAPTGQQAAARAASPGSPWIAVAKSVELSKFGADVQDQGTGIEVHVIDMAVKLEDASSDFGKPVKFIAALNLREGGELTAQGNVVPDGGALQADVRIKQLALAPLQPLLAKYVKLKIASGNVSAQGRLSTGAGTAKSANLRYAGALNIAGLTLNEQDGNLFAAWKDVGADRLVASLSPNLLDIPELRVVEANAKLIIEDDRSFNAARLLVQPASAATKGVAAPAAPVTAADDPFPVRIRRVRLQNAKLDFTDLSLRPQFAAKIYELNGVVNGLASNRNSRSQIELDGRVDEFGLARIRGELNPFAPRNNTDINVVFKNVDMVPASPYSMKFAGYKIAEGKISLDLQYKVRDGQLEGANQIVIDKLTLGERVDSPDALKLPLQLAIAILKDSDGRIDLGLPISGNIDDPQFSYGAIIGKAIGALLTKIVTAPFRALGGLLGISGEKLEAIDFDPGSDKLLPPEREKLRQVAQLLVKRPQLNLSVPGPYSEAADGAALRARAVRAEIARRAGTKLQPGEEPGPLDLADRAVRSALRDLYAARFGDAELDKQKKAAEGAATAPAVAASAPDLKSETAQARLPLFQRVGKMIQGEPQVADASAFYNKLTERLNQNQPLAADELSRLGARRAEAILAALKEAGVDSARAVAAAPEKVVSDAGKPVPLKLGLATKSGASGTAVGLGPAEPAPSAAERRP